MAKVTGGLLPLHTAEVDPCEASKTMSDTDVKIQQAVSLSKRRNTSHDVYQAGVASTRPQQTKGDLGFRESTESVQQSAGLQNPGFGPGHHEVGITNASAKDLEVAEDPGALVCSCYELGREEGHQVSGASVANPNELTLVEVEFQPKLRRPCADMV